MSDRILTAVALLVGALATWLLTVLTGVLLLPAAAVLAVAGLTWRVRRDVAVALGLGAVAVTAFLGWLLASLGSGLSAL